VVNTGLLSTTTALRPAQWRALAREHAERTDRLTARWREAHDAHRKHEIEDFLFSYYPIRPSRLRTWSPGFGTVLLPELHTELLPDDPSADPAHDLSQRASARWMTVLTETDQLTGADQLTDSGETGPDLGTDLAGGVTLDVAAYMADRGSTVRYIHTLLSNTATRPTNLGCFGLHEWAMVYKQDDTRHTLPLRLGGAGTDQVVEIHKIRCTHFDAYRFFTPEAAPLNKLHPTRELQPAMEQPGCLHANMDLYKWAWKLTPAIPGDLLLDCFELARDIRYLDMQASPYDVSKFGLPAVRIETDEGKATYQAAQAEFAERSQPLRARIIALCEQLMAAVPA